MPTLTAIPVSDKPCAHPGCPHLRTGPRYCHDHADDEKLYDRERNRSEFRRLYQSPRWTFTRRVVLVRDPICVLCQRHAATVADHFPMRAREIVARIGVNEFFNPERCRGLCKPCHDRHTTQESGFVGAH